MNQFKSTKARKQIKSKLESELNSNEDMVSLVSNTLVGAEARLKIASIKSVPISALPHFQTQVQLCTAPC